MKKIIYLSSLLFFTSFAFGQTQYPQLEEIRKSFQPILDEQIPTGILSDVNLGSGIFDRHRGKNGDSINDPIEMLDVIQNLKNSASNYNVLPDKEYVLNRVADFKKAGFIPVSFINYEYARFADSVYNDEVVDFDSSNNQFKFVKDPTNYFDLDTTVAFAIHGGLTNSRIARYVFPKDLYFTNLSALPYLLVDFADGKGWQTVQFDLPYTVEYPPYEGPFEEYIVRILPATNITPMNYNDFIRGKTYALYYPAPDLTLLATQLSIDNPCEIEGTSSINEARFYVRYGKAQSVTKVLKKPFIMVEGFDLDLNPADDKFGVVDWGTFIAGVSFDERNNPTRENLADLRVLAQKLYDLDYDCILVDFKDGAGDMFKNGNALIKIIQWVNQNKNSDEELVVMGASMGGLLARYALRTMEMSGCTPCTKLYGTFDSPHQGANVPIAMQYAIKSLIHISTEAEMGYQFLYKPAAQQMLIDNLTDPDKIARKQWQNHLDKIGHPEFPKRIALTNGSPNGSNNFLANPGDLMYSYDLEMKAKLIYHDGITLGKTVQLPPTITGNLFAQKNGGSQIVFKGTTISEDDINRIEDLVNNMELDKIKAMSFLKKVNLARKFQKELSKILPTNLENSVSNAIPVDNCAGGQADYMKVLDVALKNVQMNNWFHSPRLSVHFVSFFNSVNNLGKDLLTTFVPTYSALDLNNRDFNPDLNTMFPTIGTENKALSPSSKHPFHAIFIHSDIVSPTTNQLHVLVDARTGQNVDFILSQLNTVEYKLPKVLPTGQPFESVYNYNREDDPAKRLSNIVIKNGGILHLNKEGFGEFGNGAKPASSDKLFDYRTSACHSQITIENGGAMVVGDNNNDLGKNNRANLFISAGSTLEVQENGTLTINKGSKVVVEEGAILRVYDNAHIQLAGSKADLEIKGQVLVMNNATFKIEQATGNDNGILRVYHTAKNEGKAFIPEGEHSRIALNGNKAYQGALLNVENGPLVLKGFEEVKIENASIAINDLGTIEIHDPCSLQYLKFTPDGGNTFGTALRTFGQEGQYLERNVFEQLYTAIDLAENNSNAEVTLKHNIFNNCDNGILAAYCNPVLENNLFENCGYGLQLSQAQSYTMKSNQFKDNLTGLFIGEVDASTPVYLEDNLFKANQHGIDMAYPAQLTLSCNRFYANQQAINAYGELNLSSTRSSQGNTGGNNTFFQNVAAIQLNNASLYLDQGHNNFIGNSGSNNHQFIMGGIESQCQCLNTSNELKAEGNYWYPVPASGNITNAGSAYYQLKYLVYPHPADLYLDGQLLSKADNQCFKNTDEDLPQNNAQFKRSTVNENEFFVHCFPNPWHGDLTISVSLIHAGNITLSLIDMKGGQIMPMKNYTGNAGNNVYYLPEIDLASGIYTLKIETPDGNFYQKIVK